MWRARWRSRTCRGPTTDLPTPAIRQASCSATSTEFTGFRARPIARAAIAAIMASFSIEARERGPVMNLTQRFAATASRSLALRLMAVVGCAAFLAGCVTDQTMPPNYPRMVASAGPCGLWPHDIGPTSDREHNENLEYWNFGCASQRNLAASVEDPADLVQPRGEQASYTPRRTTVVEKYRKGDS